MTAISITRAKRFRKDPSISSHENTGIKHLPKDMLDMIVSCLSSQEQARVACTDSRFSKASKSAGAYHVRVQELGKTIWDNSNKLRLFFEQEGFILKAIQAHQLIHKDKKAVRSYLVKFFIAKILHQSASEAGINFFKELPEHLKSYITKLNFEDISKELLDAKENHFSCNEAFYNRLLAHCPYLKNLVVVGRFDDHDELLAAAMNQCQRLWSLRLRYVGSIGEDFFSRLRLPCLERLGIDTNALTDARCYSFFRSSDIIRQLRVLDVSVNNPEFTGRALKDLPGDNQLEVVRLHSHHLMAENIKQFFQKLSKIRVLKITDSSNLLDALEGIPSRSPLEDFSYNTRRLVTTEAPLGEMLGRARNLTRLKMDFDSGNIKFFDIVKRPFDKLKRLELYCQRPKKTFIINLFSFLSNKAPNVEILGLSRNLVNEYLQMLQGLPKDHSVRRIQSLLLG